MHAVVLEISIYVENLGNKNINIERENIIYIYIYRHTHTHTLNWLATPSFSMITKGSFPLSINVGWWKERKNEKKTKLLVCIDARPGKARTLGSCLPLRIAVRNGNHLNEYKVRFLFVHILPHELVLPFSWFHHMHVLASCSVTLSNSSLDSTTRLLASVCVLMPCNGGRLGC